MTDNEKKILNQLSRRCAKIGDKITKTIPRASRHDNTIKNRKKYLFSLLEYFMAFIAVGDNLYKTLCNEIGFSDPKIKTKIDDFFDFFENTVSDILVANILKYYTQEENKND